MMSADNRKMLLDMMQGGDGHTEPWIERVIVEKAGEESPIHEEVEYIVHTYEPLRHDWHTNTDWGARSIYRMAKYGGSWPKDFDEDSVPIADYGRRITKEK